MPNNDISNDPAVRLRVADAIRPGVFATDLLVFSGAHEFVLDFVQNLEIPIRVVARVVLPRAVLHGMIEVMRQGVSAPKQAQVPPVVVDAPQSREVAPSDAGVEAETEAGSPVGKPTTVSQPKQIYDDIKLPEAVQSGAYANALITAHNDQIFRMDFVAQFCPDPVLTARVFVTKAQAAQVLAALEHVGKEGK